MPGLELAHHEGARKNVQMALDRGVGFSQRSGELGRIPNLAVIVRQHHPQAAQGDGSHLNAELPDVSLEKSLNEVVLPGPALGVTASQE